MGGGIELIRALNDLGLESEIPDLIARSESAKNDLFSKSRLLPIYELVYLNKVGVVRVCAKFQLSSWSRRGQANLIILIR